jgi:hypothetical protein
MEHTKTVYVTKPNYRTFSTVSIHIIGVAPTSPIFTAPVFVYLEKVRKC